MAYYLQMDGVDDRLTVPSMDFDAILYDGSYTPANSKFYLYNGTGTVNANGFRRNSSGQDTWGSVFTGVEINGVSQTNTTVFMPVDTRATIKVTRTSGTAIDTTFFATAGSTNYIAGKAWDIKFYNGATLVAHYDMTLGNVLDQSGNGRHATLTGGTWVADGGTTHNASASLTATGSLTAVGTLYKLGSATLQGTSSLTANASLTIMGGASLAGTSALSATGFVGGIITGSASLVGTSSLSATAISGAQIARLINLLGSKPLPISLFGEKPSTVNLLGGWMATIALSGEKPLPVSLEGGLMTTKINQDFTMYAGDTPPFTITMSDSTVLTGATVEWVMRRGHVKGVLAVTKSTTDGIAVSGTVMTITLASADTLSLEGKYYHEAEVTDVSGLVSTVSSGIITILPSGT